MISKKRTIKKPALKKPVKNSSPFWRAVTLLFSITILICTAWIAYSPILETPQDVVDSRETFAVAKEIFQKNPKYWNLKREQIEQKISVELGEKSGESLPYLIHEITPEMLVSFAVESLHKPLTSCDKLSFSPKVSGSSLLVLLSKYEKNAWPLPVVLSLELETRMTPHGSFFTPRRLRRGSQELPLSLAPSYFGADLDLLNKYVQPFADSQMIARVDQRTSSLQEEEE